MSELIRSRDNVPPPPPPPGNPHSKTSPVVLKMRTVSPSHFFQTQPRSQNGPAPTGLYFFYGSLQDPSLLTGLLDLKEVSRLRAACVEGYKCKLWGDYPALLPGDPKDVVIGTVYEVLTTEHAEKLATYEGPSYTTVACSIRYTDGGSPVQVEGYVFLFVGNMRDVNEGTFDLNIWSGRRQLRKGN